MSASLSDTIAAVSAVIALIALLVGLYAAHVSRRVATSDFQAAEQVKADTAKLIAVLRSLMIKGALYSQQDARSRDDPAAREYIDIDSERQALQEFMQSSTALAYHSFVAKMSRQARDAGRQSEPWRIFFLELAGLLHVGNPWAAAMTAARLERQFDRLGEAEIREIVAALEDLPRAIAQIFAEREHDVLAHVLVAREAGAGISEESFIDFVRFLRETKAIDDPDLDVFWAASSSDVQLLESAHRRGADLRITSGALVGRYRHLIGEFEQRSPPAGSAPAATGLTPPA